VTCIALCVESISINPISIPSFRPPPLFLSRFSIISSISCELLRAECAARTFHPTSSFNLVLTRLYSSTSISNSTTRSRVNVFGGGVMVKFIRGLSDVFVEY